MVIHDEFEGILQPAIINTGKIIVHDAELIRIAGIGAAVAASLAAVIAVIGIGSMISITLGGGTSNFDAMLKTMQIIYQHFQH
jgi:hypothetical protein